MNHKRTALVLAALLAFGWGSAANAFTRARSEQGALLHWDNHAPIVVVTEGLDELERSAVRRAAATWSAAPCAKIDLVVRDAGPGAIVVKRGALTDKTFAAHTDVHADERSGLVDGAVIVLDQTRAFTTKDDPLAYDLETIVVHELGHALGFAHPIGFGLDKNSVMRAGAKPGDKRRALVDDDVKAACAVYPKP